MTIWMMTTSARTGQVREGGADCSSDCSFVCSFACSCVFLLVFLFVLLLVLVILSTCYRHCVVLICHLTLFYAAQALSFDVDHSTHSYVVCTSMQQKQKKHTHSNQARKPIGTKLRTSLPYTYLVLFLFLVSVVLLLSIVIGILGIRQGVA